jgi:hypothetical protein
VIPAPEPVMDPEPALVCGPGEWANDAMDGCEPLPEPVMEEQVPTYPQPGDYWGEGQFLVGEVIVCPPGYDVAIDEYPDGSSWAACM